MMEKWAVVLACNDSHQLIDLLSVIRPVIQQQVAAKTTSLTRPDETNDSHLLNAENNLLLMGTHFWALKFNIIVMFSPPLQVTKSASLCQK